MSQIKSSCFEVGRGWVKYVCFFLVAETCLLLFAPLVTGFNGDAWFDWCIVLVPLVAAPTVAAILVSPGSNARHAITAVALLIYSTLALLLAVDELQRSVAVGLGLFVFSVTLLQAGWIRWTRRPGWIVRPSTRRSRAAVSLKWLITATGLVAFCFTLLRLMNDPEIVIRIFLSFGPSILAAMVANLLSATHGPGLRWTVGGVAALSLMLVYALIQSGFVPFSNPFPTRFINGNETKAWFLASAFTLIIVTLTHRSFAAISSRQPNADLTKNRNTNQT